MKPVLPIFIMIDAMGWEILRNDPFGKNFAPNRKKLESVFGYSSTCVPSILSGRWPDEHYNWCYFVYDPKNSPFRSLRWMRWLPAAVTSRRIFRRYLTKFVKVQLKFRGYFDLYNIPFKFIHLFDFTEKKSPLQPNGMNRGPNIFDFLTQNKIPYFVTDTTKSEEQNRDDIIAAIEAERVDFVFQYWAGLDGLLHMVGNQSPEVPAKLRVYEEWIEKVLAAAKQHYSEIHLYIFSDHGMANCDTLVDLKAKIDALPVKMEKDYAVVYDSTMARFWFFNDRAREQIHAALKTVPEGRVMPDDELKHYRALFPDRKFGETIFLMQEGVLIVPSHMGERPIRAMHGYHPTDPQSYSTLCTNQPAIPEDVTHIPHICRIMEKTALLAKEKNSTAK
jgi:Type I phosphodiesterase / nucleotide pyrophosphatase